MACFIYRKTLVRCLCDLLYADDTALVAHSLPDIQEILNRFAQSASAFGLTINIKKTEVLYQPAPGQTPMKPDILLDGSPLNVVQSSSTLAPLSQLETLMQSSMAGLRLQLRHMLA